MSAAPTLPPLFPLAAPRGASSLVSIGKAEAFVGLESDSPWVKLTATPGLGIYNVDVAGDALPGPILVRAINHEGASAPRAFVITATRELLSTEPNESPTSAQMIASLPAIISGRMEKNGDVDCFAVELKRGQVLLASVQSHVFASTLDPLVRIVDERGHVLGFNHDSRTLDPFLAWEAPRDGTFIVQVMGFAYPAQASVTLFGGENCIYRLHLSAGPTVRATAPLHVQAGVKTELQLAGWNLPGAQREFDPGAVAAGESVPAPFGVELDFLTPLRVSTNPEYVETEPRDSATPLPVPGAITGRIRVRDEVDRYAFAASKGRTYEFTVAAAEIRSPLDAWVAIQDAAGKEVGRNDDGPAGRDPRLTWTAPADGTFTVAIGDLTHRGSEESLYRLSIAEAAPAVQATTSAHAFTVASGGSSEAKITIKRTNGFKEALEIVANDLPPGVSAPAVVVPEKDGEVPFVFVAEADCLPGNQSLRLKLRETASGREHPVVHPLASTSENNGVPQGYSELVVPATDWLWLTVVPKPSE